jgi:hypothetical protein
MTRARDVADMITHAHQSGLTYVKTTGNAVAGQVAVTGLTYTAGFVDIYLAAGDLIQVVSYSATTELGTQLLSADGGSASETYTSEQTINGGAASG